MTITATETRIHCLRTEAGQLERGIIAERIKAASSRQAHDRQRRMHVVTICDKRWLDTHTERFIRLARKAMPDAAYTLVYVGTARNRNKSKTPDMFDVVRTVKDDKTAPGYLRYNEIRYSLCSMLNLPEVVYLDPDVDIVSDISAILDDCAAEVGWCRSPVEPQGFGDAMRKLGLSGDGPWANSGTLVLRRDCAEQYAAAAEGMKRIGFPPRMIGNAAFSAMLRAGGIDHQEIPYKYGCIWHDYERLSRALCVHYCNDQGKARRVALDQVWVG